MSEKKSLHQSHLQTLWRCGYKFEQVVINGRREPSRTPLVIGCATHNVNAKNLQNKIDTGLLFNREAVQDFARDSFVKEWNSFPLVLDDEEKALGLDKTRGRAQDHTIQMAMVYHYAVASQIIPKNVERSWKLKMENFPFDLSGTWDVDEDYFINDNRIVTIRDTKTKKTNAGYVEVDRSDQYTVYALAKKVIDGAMPTSVYQDNLLRPTKTRSAVSISYESKRTVDDFKTFYNRFEIACKIIEHQCYAPANPQDWWCSKEFCGFAAEGTCPYFNSKRISASKDLQKLIKPVKVVYI